MSAIGKILEYYASYPFNNITIEIIEEDIRTNCPGDYIMSITEKNRGINVNFVFKNPEDVTLFRIKGWM